MGEGECGLLGVDDQSYFGPAMEVLDVIALQQLDQLPQRDEIIQQLYLLLLKLPALRYISK